MRVAIGMDANGLVARDVIVTTLAKRDMEVVDFSDDTLDYPDIAWRVAKAVSRREVDRAILVCGTGIGMCIVANKVRGVRAFVATDPYSVQRSILSNNVQILTLGAQVTGPRLMAELIEQWLDLEWAGGPSARKVDRIAALETEKP